MKLNLGCGPVQPPGWVNVDGSHRAWLASRWAWADRLLTMLGAIRPTSFGSATCYANLEKKFPWPDDAADAIYLGEMLEHFTRDRGLQVLAECRRVLKPGGVLRIRVPDNARFWSNYLAEYAAAKQKPQAEWTLAHTRWIDMFFREICVRRSWLGSMGHFHKWMYDEISLVKTLEGLGFCDVARRAFHDSRIGDIAAVEVRDDLIVECFKPGARAPLSQAVAVRVALTVPARSDLCANAEPISTVGLG